MYLYTNEKKEKYLSELYELINLQIDNWNRADNSYANLTFGYGLTSLAWTIELILSSTIHIDKIDDWIEDVDAILINQYNLMLQQYNFDYFKGATGLLFYFLTKTKRLDCTELLVDKFLFALDGSKHKENSYYYKDLVNNNQQLKLNIGVPHGITGIILTLLIVKEKKIKCDIDKTLFYFLEKLMNNEVNDEEQSWHFPSTVISGFSFPSALAWCYGDIMAGYALYKFGILYENDYYYSHGLKILKETTLRKNQLLNTQNLILCHGYPSIICIFDEIYKRTRDKVFMTSANYYRDIAFKDLKAIFEEQEIQNNFSDSFLGNFSLFYGLPGLVLSLLDSKENKVNWKSCLLI